VVEETVLPWRNALDAAAALVDGHVGMVIAPAGRLRSVLTLRFEEGRVTEYAVVADPARLAALERALLD
jgi:RNA polymerase sigma-70 factor (ECF subfamily)